MRKFDNITAASFEDASALASQNNTVVMAGGTDLMNTLSKALLPEAPEKVIDLKKIPGAAGIEDRGDTIEIGALTTLADIVDSDIIAKKVPILKDAAQSVATALVRNAGTIGGNIMQDVRCWYYRYPHEGGGRFHCQRKGGNECYAIHGENRYHSIFGGMKAHTTPCQSECPAGTDIPAYMSEIREGNWGAAAEIFMDYNPMPMLTSRICPHPCQDVCNQNESGDCVNIHCVERALGDYILEHADEYYQAPAQETGKTAAVIGAGPGGLAAAYYLRKAGNRVVVYDNMEKPGGVLMYGIPHYRLPRTYIEQFTDALQNMGIEFQMKTEVGKDVSMEDLKAEYDTVYIGTGAWKAPVLGLEGENLTEFGLNFLVEVNTYLQKAIGEDVLVCGGGNVAMDVALTAVRLGAKKVKLVCLEERDQMPASAEEIARAEEEGVEIINGWGLDSVLTEAGKVCGLKAKKCTSVFDENGRFSPEYSDETMQIDSDYIILATGQKVDLDFLGTFADQIKTSWGLIGADAETYATKEKGVYAGGDAVTGGNIAIRAIAAGRIAAGSMNREMGVDILVKPEKEKFIHHDVKSIENKVSCKAQERPIGERTLTDEDSATLTPEEAQEEAGRCMNCGCYSVNASDITPVLVALNADVVTTKKTIKASDLFTTTLKASDMLEAGELVTKIVLPNVEDQVSHYEKLRIRKSLDFALVSLASVYRKENGVLKDVRLVLGGAAPVPYKLIEVEQLLEGKAVSDDLAKEAGQLAVRDAQPLEKNTYKVSEANALVCRFVESAR